VIPLCKVYVDENEINSVIKVLESGWYTHGPKNKEFEERFAEYIGVKHTVSMNSCTSALITALEASEIKGEVILPSFTFVASANAIVKAGATPVFADIYYDTCNIDPDSIEALITPDTEALMIVHFGGQSCRMDKIIRLADTYNLTLIEDSAETIGGKFKNKFTGSFGTGCFSFFPTKNITTGEGGLISTNDTELYNKINALIGHGIISDTSERTKEEKPWLREAHIAGYNFRLSNILAAIGVEQLKKINEMNRFRTEKSILLMELLNDIDEIDLPVIDKDCSHVFQMFSIKINEKYNRDEFVLKLRKNGIGASVHFFPPVHLQNFYKTNYPSRIDLPVTEDVSKKIITLPMYPQITIDDLKIIAKTIKELLIEK